MLKMTLKSVFLVIIGIVLVWSYTPGVAAGGAYYVSPDGNDGNPGTEAQPWQTVAKAADAAQAGDTVYFMAGVYPGILRPRHSGVEGSPITFTAYPGHVATIDGGETSKGEFGGVVDIHVRSHIIVSNLRVINGGHFGIRVSESDHILIQGNVTDFTFSSGIYVAASRQVVIDGNEVMRACHGVGGQSPQEHITVRGGTHGFEVHNNYVHGLYNNEGKEGINIKEGASDGKVYNNVVDGMSRTGLYVDAFDSYVNNVEIFGNVVTNSLHGIVLASERRGTISNVSIYNNVFYNNSNNGIWITHYLQGGPMANIRIINNTVYNNADRGIAITNPESTHVVVRNNIVLNNQQRQLYVDPEVANVIVDHNQLEGDASFINPLGGDFRLQANSIAIDAGSDQNAPAFDFVGNGRPHGGGHDLGAFEQTEAAEVSQPVSRIYLPFLMQ